MIELYSGVIFFVSIIALSFFLLAIKKANLISSVYYSCIVCILSLLLASLIYYTSYIMPLTFLFTSAGTFQLYRKGYLSKISAVILTMAPLLGIKSIGLPGFAFIGLSFATFRAIDVLLYSKENERIDWLQYVAYLFFPLTLLAGPMYRWQTFKNDLQLGLLRLSTDTTLNGFETVLLGIAQKFLVAEVIDRLLLSNINANDYTLGGIAKNAFVYTAFLYFDFSGYSNMALGVGKMLGLELPRNFNNPILARNPQDFWRRWHISLSEWLRDVVFMPVYMTLCKIYYFKSRRLFAQNIGIFLTLLAMGVWNGFSLHYIISGIMFGSYSVVFNLMVNSSRTSPRLAWIMSNSVCCFLGRVMTIVLAILALYVFSGRSPI